MERDWKKYKFEVLVTNVERKEKLPHFNLFNKKFQFNPLTPRSD